jgi:hypothetical protein
MYKIFPYCLILTLWFSTLNAHEEWVIQKFNTSFASIGYQNYHTSHFWNKSGKKRKAYNRFHENQYSFYAQYGLTPLDTIGLTGSFDRIQESMNGRLLGWTDFELDWKHLFQCVPHGQFFMQVIAILPSKTVFQPAVRYGRFGGEFALHYRKVLCIQEQRCWFELKGGYRTYQGFPSDQLRAYLRVAYNPYKPVDLIASSYLEYGVFNGNRKINQSLVAFSANYRLLRIQLEAVAYFLDRFSVAGGYFWHVWGENVGTGGGAFANASVRF